MQMSPSVSRSTEVVECFILFTEVIGSNSWNIRRCYWQLWKGAFLFAFQWDCSHELSLIAVAITRTRYSSTNWKPQWSWPKRIARLHWYQNIRFQNVASSLTLIIFILKRETGCLLVPQFVLLHDPFAGSKKFPWKVSCSSSS